MGLFAYQSPASIKATIFAQMRELGADYLEAGYSGGNDEGGVDDVTLFRRAQPRKRKDVSEVKVEGKLTRMERVALPPPGYLDYQHPLHEAIDDLLSIDFGSWAGEFHAHGTVIADALTGKVTREGSQSHESWENDGGSY
jgi:hypothetical protein